MSDLRRELKYFIDHQSELVKEYKGKFLVIIGEKVVGVYDSTLDAYDDAKSKYEAGTYLIQECIEGKDAYTQVFHSRVAFV